MNNDNLNHLVFNRKLVQFYKEDIKRLLSIKSLEERVEYKAKLKRDNKYVVIEPELLLIKENSSFELTYHIEDNKVTIHDIFSSWESIGNEVLHTAVCSNHGELTIPSEIDGYEVCTIDEFCCAMKHLPLLSIIVPPSVKEIKKYAFCDLPEVYNIVISGDFTDYSDDALQNCRVVDFYHESKWYGEYLEKYDLTEYDYELCRNIAKVSDIESQIRIISTFKRNSLLYGEMFGLHRLESPSGLFWVDFKGTILALEPFGNNLYIEPQKIDNPWQLYKTKDIIHLETLIVPEGVKQFPAEFIRRYHIDSKIIFPSTLEAIGDIKWDDKHSECHSVLADTHLPEVIIPKSVTMIGTFAFGNSHIKKLVFENIISSEYARQFKDSRIDELVIPKTMWESDGIARNFKIHCRIDTLKLI